MIIKTLRGLHLTGVDLRSTLQNPQVRPGSSTCHADSGGRALTCAAPVKWRPHTLLMGTAQFPVSLRGEQLAAVDENQRPAASAGGDDRDRRVAIPQLIVGPRGGLP